MSEPGPKRSRQRKARKYALDILFAADLRQCPVDDVVADYAAMGDHPIPDYALRLAQGVASHDYLLDGYLAPSLGEGWTVDRMPRVDRCLAHIATYEMLYEDIPPQVAISEAVGLAQELSTDESPGFLTGALGKVASLVPGVDYASSIPEGWETDQGDSVQGADSTDDDPTVGDDDSTVNTVADSCDLVSSSAESISCADGTHDQSPATDR